MFVTFKRLVNNRTYMYNSLASMFYFLGYLPFWVFTPKYIEIQYRQSASVSSLVTGTVAVVFSAIGILLAGFVISKFKPNARLMAFWNILVGVVSVLGILSYTQLGCADIQNSLVVNGPISKQDFSAASCNINCNCEYVKYAPVCGQDGTTYISACHAGCTDQIINGKDKLYTNCSCIESSNTTNVAPLFEKWITSENVSSNLNINSITTITKDSESYLGGFAVAGSCPVNCFREFVFFLSIMCFMKFVGSTGRTANFLISIRCVEEKDKTVAMGFGVMLMCLFAFIPSPVLFGYILDQTCLVWGKVCSTSGSGSGNCWLYDGAELRWNLNTIAAAFVAMGAIFDIGMWYYVKNLKIYDDITDMAIRKLNINSTIDDTTIGTELQKMNIEKSSKENIDINDKLIENKS